MRKRTMAIVITSASVLVLGATAAVAGPMIYRDFIAAPAEQAPTLSADDSAFASEANTEIETNTEIEASQLDGVWTVADGSSAGYRVDEVLNGQPVTVTGRTTEVTGSLSFRELTLESAEFEVDVASIATDNSQRDNYFRQQALGVDEHPTARFELSDPVTAAHVPAAGEVVEQTLTGDLTLAGATHRVTFEVQVRTDGETTEIAGQIPIAFADFGIEAPNLGFVAVEPTGYVEFSLVAMQN